MTNNSPIGVFDSGLGGISVVNEIHKIMPHEDIIFFGDSANAPYGTRSTQEVQQLSFAAADRLIENGAKAIVIACNTATSAAADSMRERYDVPIIGMEPALKLACDLGHGEPQHVIVTATPLTLREQKFARLMNRFSATHTIEKQPCPRLVEIVENGQIENSKLVYETLHSYLDQYDMNSVDSIVLGCTHFTYFRSYFENIVDSHVQIVDGNEGTARHLHEILKREDLLNEWSILPPSPKTGTITLTNSSSNPRLLELAEYFVER
ncbi:glutamate racemase [Alloscardovia theropitheci]|uniref:Glutamate racemase n=1 Tax=Alloscardovia theropitheci TaxID=2496842 RepID=A0A4R0QQW5_9BIFI|nr:glutamate racemase [Alloscardovia theropitheci]TCD54714.1 glutamate racemase [Alloscardovia theropitheci]